MSAVVRPIYMPGAAAFDWVRQRALVALEAWAGEWVSAWHENRQVLATLRIGPMGEAAEVQRNEYHLIDTKIGCMWSRCNPADCLNFDRAVVGAELLPHSGCADEWINGFTDEAWNARNHALATALLSTVVSGDVPAIAYDLPSSLFAVGSGAARLTCDALGLHAIVDSSVWRSVPPNPPARARWLTKLTPMDEAAHGARARLDVVLGSVDIELAKLLDLQRGDVLRLPRRRDEALAVLCEGKPMARAILGTTDGHKSIQILSNDPNDEQHHEEDRK